MLCRFWIDARPRGANAAGPLLARCDCAFILRIIPGSERRVTDMEIA